MKDKYQQMMEHLDRGNTALREAIVAVDSQTEIYPQWRIQEILAHLAGWDTQGRMAIQAFVEGTDVPLLEGEVDDLNACFVAARKDLDYEGAIHDWETARQLLKDALLALPADQLNTSIPFPWGGSGTAIQLAAGLAHHDQEHAKEIRQGSGG